MALVIHNGRSRDASRPTTGRPSGDFSPAPIAGQLAWALVLLALIALAFAKLAG